MNITCKMCKNLSKFRLESDEKGNIIEFRPNSCKISNKEIVNIKSTCSLKGSVGIG